MEFLQQHELDQLFARIPEGRDRLLAKFLYECGCTVSETSSLKSSAVRIDGTVHFTDRTCRISESLAHELLAQAEEYIFHTRQTQGITPKRIQQILKPYLATVHKGKITPHVLRYTHIMHAYQRGIPFHAIAAQTGLTTVRLGQLFADMPSHSGYNNFFGGKP